MGWDGTCAHVRALICSDRTEGEREREGGREVCERETEGREGERGGGERERKRGR